jgi:regulator of protease activity HflC (stomatin/prohibitin superfamily)
MNPKKLIKFAVTTAVIVIAILVLNPLSFVGTRERGVRTMFGAIQGEETIMPGVVLRAPIVGGVKTVSIEPNEAKINIEWGSGGAISSDTQMIGVVGRIFWVFDGNQVAEILKNYTTDQIDRQVTMKSVEAIKTVIGYYTVFNLSKNMAEISSKAIDILRQNTQHLPIEIQSLVLADFDWSPEVDKIVEQTITAQQAVIKAKADADRATEENRRISIEAEAAARALVAKAEGEKQSAELMADAKRAEGQGIADYNRLIAQNMQVEVQLKQLEIQLERAKRWNGIEVPTYLPLNPAGGIVTLPGVK